MLKKLNSARFALVLVAVLSLAACKKENTPISDSAKISFSMTSDNAAVTLASVNATGQLTTFSTTTGSATLKWTDAKANIGTFKLQALKDGTAYELNSAGLAGLDLFAPSPATIDALLPKGTYTQMQLNVQLVKGSGNTVPLSIKGIYTNTAGTNVPVEFNFNETVAVPASLDDIIVDGNNNFIAKLNLNINKVFSNMTAQQLDKATRTNGTILITTSSNLDLYKQIIVGILTSSEAELESQVK